MHATPKIRGVVAGVVSALVALGAAELVAGLSARLRSPIIDVGDRVIDLVPSPIKEFAISVFGTADKLALLIGMGVLILAYAAGIGILAVRRNRWIGVAGIAAFGLVGVVAATTGAGSLLAGLPSLIGTTVGAVALWILCRQAETPEATESAYHASRRQFLLASGSALVAAGALGGAGRLADRRFNVAADRGALALPSPARSLDAIPPGTSFDVEGITPFLTPNDDFYRIDTALTVPQLSVAEYSLSIGGMVERPMTLSFDDILSRTLVESDITLTCVSNEVGGKLVGNTRWLGIRLDELLDEAGIDPSADQIVGRSVDGYTCGFPVSALDGRDALVAIGMDGEPLPLEHGFPVRLIVPGLYGYVSATKWLTEIELTTFADFDHYWVDRGWAVEAPIKTQSRIDTPRPLATLSPGTHAIAGVAWAQTRGIELVEVQIDGGEWQEAELADPLNDVTWRQWKLGWEATPGRHDLSVRATDGTGETQTSDRARPIPDGATGWHSIVVLVDES